MAENRKAATNLSCAVCGEGMLLVVFEDITTSANKISRKHEDREGCKDVKCGRTRNKERRGEERRGEQRKPLVRDQLVHLLHRCIVDPSLKCHL